MKLLQVLVLVSALTFSCVTTMVRGSSREKFVSSRLNVVVPTTLQKSGGYNHSIALFGAPKHTGSISEPVYYTNDTLCEFDYSDAIHGGWPERSSAKRAGLMKPWQAPFILLIDRSDDCNYVQQVRNAQRTGASAAVIVHAPCQCDEEGCKGNACKESLPSMADDGSGSDIGIPSALIQQVEAAKIKQEVMRNRPVRMSLTWGYPHLNRNDTVPYDFWFTPFHSFSNTFLRNFRDVARALKDHFRFTPHFYVWDGSRVGCFAEDIGMSCNHSCTSGGHYCSSFLANNFHIQNVSGADVVQESLRRLCIWKQYGNSDEIGASNIWWDYIYWFLEHCEDHEKFNDETCIDYVYDLAGIDRKTIAVCATSSQTNTTTNLLLDSELDSQAKFGITKVPTMVVDDVIVERFESVALTVSNVFGSLCGRYFESTAPQICQKCARTLDTKDCILSYEARREEDPINSVNHTG